VAIGIVVMSLNVLFSLAFSALFTSLGWPPHGGLALANTLATALEAVGLWVFMRRRLNGLEGRRILQGSLQALAASLVMGLGLVAWLRLSANFSAWVIVGGGLVVGGLLFGLVVLALKNAEALSLLRLVKRRLGISR
jgi:putative peptidoglycan lipid II flippase